ncbi:MAG: hypothetical protein GWP91_05830 [Rhodobacterales bacterium]|nr:hypothetical protein [Rhodobacterales bacterium]
MMFANDSSPRVNSAIKETVAASPTLQIDADLGIQLLALVVTVGGEEAYRVSFRTSSDGPFVAGESDGASAATRLTWIPPTRSSRSRWATTRP